MKFYLCASVPLWLKSIAAAALVLLPLCASAHMLPYLTWFKVERNMELHSDQVRITYNCTFNPTIFDPKSPLMDTDMDSTASQHEIGAFCMQADQYLGADLLLVLDGQPLGAREESFYMRDDDSGFQTVFTAGLPPLEAGPHQVDWIDPSFMPVALPAGMAIEQTTATITSYVPEIQLVDVPNANRKSKSIRLPSSFRTTFVMEKAASKESNAPAVKSNEAQSTQSVTGTH